MRWLVVVVPLLTFSVVVSPPDPLSMLIVAVPLFLTFAFGSYWGPHLRSSEDNLTPKARGVGEA
jgi:Sec-independent protein secretion pathway component TatC